MGSFKLVKLIFLLAILRTNLGGKPFFEMLQKATKHSSFLREYESDIECIKDTLRLVTVIFRHGQRTPADTYPTDPHINDSMVPYGWGQLTNTQNARRITECMRALEQALGFIKN